jgi:hypothetical protein
MMWFKPASGIDQYNLFGSETFDGTLKGLHLYFSDGGAAVKLGFADNDCTWAAIDKTLRPRPGMWSHVAFMVTATEKKVYLNGKRLSTKHRESMNGINGVTAQRSGSGCTTTTLFQGAGNVQIGKAYNTFEHPFTGAISEPEVFGGVALSDAEVLDSFRHSGGLLRACSDFDALAASAATTLTSNPCPWRQPDDSYLFDGSKWVTLGTTTQEQMVSQPFSVMFWYRPTSSANPSGGFLGTPSSGLTSKYMHLTWLNAGKIRWGYYGDDCDYQMSENLIPAGGWIHLAYVQVSSNLREWYLNGQFVDSCAKSWFLDGGDEEYVIIGGYNSPTGPTSKLKGHLRDFSLYGNEAKTAADVLAAYTQQSAQVTWSDTFTDSTATCSSSTTVTDTPSLDFSTGCTKATSCTTTAYLAGALDNGALTTNYNGINGPAAGVYIDVDLKAPTSVKGIATQSRGGGWTTQKITAFALKFSVDGSSWTPIDNGAVFAGPGASDAASVVKNVDFAEPVTARYFRVFPVACGDTCSGRIGPILCGDGSASLSTLQTFAISTPLRSNATPQRVTSLGGPMWMAASFMLGITFTALLLVAARRRLPLAMSTGQLNDEVRATPSPESGHSDELELELL